jgi:SAM-dependent methyltransferase
MAEARGGSSGQDGRIAGLDTSVAHPARVYDYWLGGKDNFAADREVGEQTLQAYPDIALGVRSNRAFLGRAVRYLAGEAGVRQFLDIGTGLPTVNNTHEVAQAVAPEARVVYVDKDPFVLAHARALLASNPRGVDYIEADLYDPATLIGRAREKLDFSQPVAIMLMGVMGHVGNPAEADDDVARSIVEQLKAALPSGGYLIMYEGTDTDPAQREALKQYNESGAVPYRLRDIEQIARFFDELELVPPGLVPIHEWRPDPSSIKPPEVPALGAVGKKP